MRKLWMTFGSFSLWISLILMSSSACTPPESDTSDEEMGASNSAIQTGSFLTSTSTAAVSSSSVTGTQTSSGSAATSVGTSTTSVVPVTTATVTTTTPQGTNGQNTSTTTLPPKKFDGQYSVVFTVSGLITAVTDITIQQHQFQGALSNIFEQAFRFQGSLNNDGIITLTPSSVGSSPAPDAKGQFFEEGTLSGTFNVGNPETGGRSGVFAGFRYLSPFDSDTTNDGVYSLTFTQQETPLASGTMRVVKGAVKGFVQTSTAETLSIVGRVFADGKLSLHAISGNLELVMAGLTGKIQQGKIQDGRFSVKAGPGGLYAGQLITTPSASKTNLPPVADPGKFLQEAFVSKTVTLDASASTDPEGSVLTYSWSLQARPPQSSSTLNKSGGVQTAFTPDLEGIYKVLLTVSDGEKSATAQITLVAVK